MQNKLLQTMQMALEVRNEERRKRCQYRFTLFRGDPSSVAGVSGKDHGVLVKTGLRQLLMGKN
jgi:hypothetical protein